MGSSEFTELLAPGSGEQFTQIAERVLRTGEGQRAELDVVIRGERRAYDCRPLLSTSLGQER